MTTSPQATLSNGLVRGTEEAGVVRYLGIPYAQAPFGENRFRAPQPVPAWEGVREATQFGPTPPQVPYAGAIGELLGSVRIDGDDILTANVWAPADASGAPVLLWIHGGALERGTAALPLYDGTVFAAAGLVFVSKLPTRFGGLLGTGRRPAEPRPARCRRRFGVGAPRGPGVRRRPGADHRHGRVGRWRDRGRSPRSGHLP